MFIFRTDSLRVALTRTEWRIRKQSIAFKRKGCIGGRTIKFWATMKTWSLPGACCFSPPAWKPVCGVNDAPNIALDLDSASLKLLALDSEVEPSSPLATKVVIDGRLECRWAAWHRVGYTYRHALFGNNTSYKWVLIRELTLFWYSHIYFRKVCI